ncbi:MAG: flagellar basal body-associated FliL family protein [Pseudomonadota bacterium]
MKKLLPVILPILGIVAGGGVGYVLKPEPEIAPLDAEAMLETGDAQSKAAEKAANHQDAFGDAAAPEPAAVDSIYHPLSRKVIVPYRRPDGANAFVLLDLNLELSPENPGLAETHEPRLMDAFLRTVVSFTTTGAFDDPSQASALLRDLNAELLKSAQAVLGGGVVRNVLIVNLVTQEA